MKGRGYGFRFRTELGYGEAYGDTGGFPFYEHFYAGGLNSVRGYERWSLGPRSTPATLDPETPDPEMPDPEMPDPGDAGSGDAGSGDAGSGRCRIRRCRKVRVLMIGATPLVEMLF